MDIFDSKRKFYVKVSGAYLYKTDEGFEYIKDCNFQKKVLYAYEFTDKEYDSVKHLLPQNHTLELVK